MLEEGAALARHCMIEALLHVLTETQQEKAWLRFRRNASLVYGQLTELELEDFRKTAASFGAESPASIEPTEFLGFEGIGSRND